MNDNLPTWPLARLTINRRRAMLLAMASAALAPLSALSEPSLQQGSVADTVQQLKPGEFIWAPDIAPEGPVLIIVSVATQRAYAYRNGVPIGISTVSTGKKGYETPTGVFTILQKHVDHKSNLYNDAPMPYMQRLTWGGVAMHAGNLPGYPASHGCIRLPLGFARQLYGITRLGLTVVITDHAEVPRVAPSPWAMRDHAAGPTLQPVDGDIVWHPERSPTGPISIVISAADKRLVVLRNGVSIGSAPVIIDAEVTHPHAFSLRAIRPDGFDWLQLFLPGQTPETSEVQATDRAKLHMPEDFRRLLASTLTPGTTVVVTPDTLQSGSTGKKLTVIKSDDK